MGAPTIFTPKAPYKGALLNADTSETMPNSATTLIEWNGVHFDTHGFWSGSNPSRLTIPAGVKKVRFSMVSIPDDTSSSMRHDIYLYKNGNPSWDGTAWIKSNNGAEYIACCSPVIEVDEGDYFEMAVFHTRGSTVNPSNQMTFGIEVVE